MSKKQSLLSLSLVVISVVSFQSSFAQDPKSEDEDPSATNKLTPEESNELRKKLFGSQGVVFGLTNEDGMVKVGANYQSEAFHYEDMSTESFDSDVFTRHRNYAGGSIRRSSVVVGEREVSVVTGDETFTVPVFESVQNLYAEAGNDFEVMLLDGNRNSLLRPFFKMRHDISANINLTGRDIEDEDVSQDHVVPFDDHFIRNVAQLRVGVGNLLDSDNPEEGLWGLSACLESDWMINPLEDESNLQFDVGVALEFMCADANGAAIGEIAYLEDLETENRRVSGAYQGVSKINDTTALRTGIRITKEEDSDLDLYLGGGVEWSF